MKGKFVLIPFPFTNLTAAKLRPALTDVVVEESHSEFVLTGLKMSSVIRLDKIATILKDLVVGEIGELGGSLREK